LNRRPLASRSWTKSIAYQNPGRVGIGSTMRGTDVDFFCALRRNKSASSR
jgi:hypothetical protein